MSNHHRRPPPSQRTLTQAHALHRKPRPKTAEDYIWPMPSLEEVVAAGYVPEYHASVKKERDEFIARFNSDPVFAEEAKRGWAEREANRAREDADRAREEAEQRQRGAAENQDDDDE